MVRNAGPGNYGDGNGLMLRVRKSGSRQWIQRVTIHGCRVDLGLGSADLVKLANARRVAADNRTITRTGGNPRRARVPTFAVAEKECFAQKRDTWRTASLAMDKHVLPKIGGMPMDRVGSAAVNEALRPTGRRGGGAITAVLEWARIEAFRTEESPVETVRRNLPKRATGPNHHEALHWRESGLRWRRSMPRTARSRRSGRCGSRR